MGNYKLEHIRVPLFELFDSPGVDMCSSMNQIPPAHFSPESKRGRNNIKHQTVFSILLLFYFPTFGS